MVGGRLCYFLVMEYAEGQTLRELLAELGKVPEALLREIAIQTSAGLAAIHAEGILHRDLKPENILLARDQRVRIMDLGVAKVEDASESITKAGKFAGSLPYVAPEVIRQESLGPAADLYSLGVLLHELATGANDDALVAGHEGELAEVGNGRQEDGLAEPELDREANGRVGARLPIGVGV